jgi:hypothetical protein
VCAFNLKTVDQAACPKLNGNVNASSDTFSGLRGGYSLLEGFAFCPLAQARICKLSFQTFAIDGEWLHAVGSISEKRIYRRVSNYNNVKHQDWRLRVPVR